MAIPGLVASPLGDGKLLAKIFFFQLIEGTIRIGRTSACRIDAGFEVSAES